MQIIAYADDIKITARDKVSMNTASNKIMQKAKKQRQESIMRRRYQEQYKTRKTNVETFEFEEIKQLWMFG